MAREYASGHDAEARINASENANELVEIYRNSGGYFQPVISRLLSLKEYDHFATVWSEEQQNLAKNSPALLIALNAVRSNTKDLCQAGKADFLVRMLLDLVSAHANTFEAFRVCQVISELVLLNKQFPSKATAIIYFQAISAMLRSTGHVFSYLNALHLLNELEPQTLSRAELAFLQEYARAQTGMYAKDLFCGIRAKEPESIAVGLEDAEFTPDDRVCCMLEMLRSEEGLENTYSNVSFLLKSSIPFVVDQGRLRSAVVGPNAFTSLIFGIAKRYEPVVVPEVRREAPRPVEKKAPPKPREEPPKEVKPKVEFKNKFTTPYKKSKLVRMYMSIPFQDVYYDERNRRREELNDALMREKEKERDFFLPHKETVDELLVELRKIQEDRANEERRVMLENAKAEEEREKEEQKTKMWRSQVKMEQNQTRPDDRTSSSIYIPPLTTLNMTTGNLPGLAGRMQARKEEEKEKGAPEEGSWRRRK